MSTPYSVRTREVTDSTQDDAREAFDGEPVLVVAARQRRGRGRSDADWETAPRAMAASVAFDPGWETARLPLIPLLAGVAAARVCGAGLKWPNDVMVDGSKVGGILAESDQAVVTVGLGLNLWWPDAPAGYGALHADDPGPEAPIDLARRWATELLQLVADGDWPVGEYRGLCTTIGGEVTWDPDGRGRAIDVDGSGALVVETDAGTVRLRSGEVRHVRTT